MAAEWMLHRATQKPDAALLTCENIHKQPSADARGWDTLRLSLQVYAYPRGCWTADFAARLYRLYRQYPVRADLRFIQTPHVIEFMAFLHGCML